MPNALAARRAAAFKNLPVHHRAQSLDDDEAPPPADGEQKGTEKSSPAKSSVGDLLKMFQLAEFKFETPDPEEAKKKAAEAMEGAGEVSA